MKIRKTFLTFSECEAIAMNMDPWAGQYFSVEFGNKRCSFYKISGLVFREKEYMTYQEGGANDYVHILSKPSDKYETAVFEKGFGTRDFDIKIGSSPQITITITHRNPKDRDAKNLKPPTLKQNKYFILEGTRVLEIKYSDLSAMSSEVMFESISVLYRRMIAYSPV